MATKSQAMQRYIRHYKRATGKTEVDMREVAKYAMERGWTKPIPKSALDLLTTEFSQAAREEIRRDKKTGRPYRGYHAFKQKQGTTQLTLWVDIDEAPRGPMQKSLINRRDQMISDGVLLTLDANHWNGINPTEKPIVLPLDFTEDVEERLSIPFEDEKAA